MTHDKFFALILLLICGSFTTHARQKDIETRLITIDSLISNYDAMEAGRLAQIEHLKSSMREQHSPEQRYLLMRKVVAAYRCCDIDSALLYAGRLITLSRTTGNSDAVLQAQLDQVAVLAGAGQLTDARTLLDNLRHEPKSNRMQIEYYGQNYYLYSLYAEYNDQGGVNRNYYYEKEFAYADSALALMKKDDPYYPLYKGWQYMRTGQSAQGISLGENYLAYRPENTTMRAAILYMMSVCCRVAGDDDQQLNYLLDAAITYLRLANANNEVMGDLVTLLCQRGYISEAYRYTSFDIKMAMKLRNRVRLVKMQLPLDMVQRAYNEKLTTQNNNMLMLIIGVGLLAIGLAFTLLYILRQQRRLARSRRELKHSNEKLGVSNSQLNVANEQLATKVDELSAMHQALEEANNQLEEANAQLSRANSDLGEKNLIKEEYIGFVLALCSDYISKLDRYRKDINRKVKTHLYAELNDMTESSVMMQSELKDFYQHFDSVFLHVYPRFVDDFNQLLQPDQQLHPKQGRLNTELRIFALMRLGITDSGKIADFLHCSLQTVYNNRLRTRQKAINRDTFDDKVSHLE